MNETKKIKIATWYTGDESNFFNKEDCDGFKIILGCDLFIQASPENQIEFRQYPYLEITTFEL